ncbi:NAD(P)(+) transhydrogenase (Re/Si-specific) subunit beta [Rhodococcus rhodnii]|uniref:NAD(P) transhydrogenase subunit beta n=2 Tax=Rhodococcus rhodnii TaxID=38312 RepID=R7WI95_9NOCA|nr:NAD(P)(+) transhydrogenase (Re/Si-specific) subunit beta [Rhodococcus rhodnii]EOM74895.1 NAD(P) transhydrogenase beta subunit [Rhodococcus rhodnii LMG 5362]TXG91659.1 NAD(P)(+) transhydrogenase (Re/Si-specific) subunit beta [Rhodococcus rhodnii]
MTYLVDVLYIVAFALFIYGLMGLTGPKTAVRGNQIAAVGMLVAVVATLIAIRDAGSSNWIIVVAGLVIGVALGIPPALRTKMTAMPQLVALFNGVGGGTVALIAWAEFLDSGGFTDFHGEEPVTHVIVASLFAAIIGSISFWGSVVAFGKLQEILPGRPIGLGKAQQAVNLVLLVVAIGIAVYIGIAAIDPDAPVSGWWMAGLLVVAGVLGLLVVLPIGGADMPVVISLLNALTGLSAAAAGLALDNKAMIVAGMIVGASGSILTNLMAKAMNRSIPAIVAGGFGGGAAAAGAGHEDRTYKSTSAADAAIQMAYGSLVIVVPGYGLAVAQAQHAVKDMAKLLEAKGVTVEYAIHPVAGRMPGHMNVLLAEADVPYDAMKEMDDVNDDFARADVALVIGANDVTNPAARNDPSSPIYGMPVLNVDDAKNVIVVKRSMSSGFAGIDNPLFYEPETSMLFGDAKKVVSEIIEELKAI